MNLMIVDDDVFPFYELKSICLVHKAKVVQILFFRRSGGFSVQIFLFCYKEWGLCLVFALRAIIVVFSFFGIVVIVIVPIGSGSFFRGLVVVQVLMIC